MSLPTKVTRPHFAFMVAVAQLTGDRSTLTPPLTQEPATKSEHAT